MKKKILVLASACLLFGSIAFAGGHGAPWGYTGDIGPEHWGDLDYRYIRCSTGKNQSPVNLTGMVEADLAPIEIAYGSTPVEVVNNGHTIQVNIAPGSTLTFYGQTFELKQFHFHTPSENKIDGKSFPLEAHFVHADKDGNLAVVALMFEEGDKNEVLEAFWSAMPENSDSKNKLENAPTPDKLLPESKDYYYFNGSLTTPPCSEGVRWIVLKAAATVSKDQVEKFAHVMHHPNNRPVQPLNARKVLK